MKKVTLIILLGIAVAAVAAINPLNWKKTSIDLGTLKAGESRSLSFEFTNDSDKPVSILEAKGSCGCTNVAYPKESLPPGATASITATFTSKKTGVFKKNIRVKTTASEEETYLYFSGEVVE